MMIRRNRFGIHVITAGMIAVVMGCREQEPLPSHHYDIGDGQAILLPTTSAWVDPNVTDGRADWVELREPDFDEVKAQDAKVTVNENDQTTGSAVEGADEIEAELRDLLSEYNDLVNDEKYEDVIEFYIPDQGDTVTQMIKAIPAMTSKFKELQAVLPESHDQLDGMLATFTLKEALKLDVETITILSEKSATGIVKDTPDTTNLPAALKQIHFTYDGEYWFIDVPIMNLAKMMLPMLEQSKASVDQLIAGIKSGDIAGDAITAQVSAMASLFSQSEIAKDKPEEADNTEDDSAEKPDENQGD